MKKLLWCICLCSIISCSRTTIKPTKGIDEMLAINPSYFELIKSYTKPFPDNTELSIAIIDHGEVSYIGVKKMDNVLVKIQNENKVFEIGSISKVFTSNLLVKLEHQKKLSTDDQLSKYLGPTNQVDSQITLQHLANHTAGLERLPSNLNLFTVDISNPYKDYGEEQLLAFYSDSIALSNKPGTSYNYTNLGSGTLGYVLTRASGSSYETLLQEHICGPLAMEQTTSLKSNIANELVPGQNPKGDVVGNWDMNVLLGAGGLYSSAKDLASYAKAQFNKSDNLFSLSHKPSFTVNENMKMGLGWHILKRRYNWLWHNGASGGYSSSITIEKRTHNAIIILSNVSAFHRKKENIDQLGFELLKELSIELVN